MQFHHFTFILNLTLRFDGAVQVMLVEREIKTSGDQNLFLDAPNFSLHGFSKPSIKCQIVDLARINLCH